MSAPLTSRDSRDTGAVVRTAFTFFTEMTPGVAAAARTGSAFAAVPANATQIVAALAKAILNRLIVPHSINSTGCRLVNFSDSFNPNIVPREPLCCASEAQKIPYV
ncbi:hypothetical protein [Novosphingobium fuchskuhlense]|uniref:hypothetical protein n=1 Tax=Novosphingobium fuchskuhlense TaxID=1117702 RepID=UPI0012E3BE0A|nr:hypothetical protein [Novosphingobium fuchskuhlense]